MKASEVLTRYAAGERNFQHVSLRGQSFKGQNLSGADFSEADLRSTDFTRANLRGANLQGAKCGLQKRWLIFLVVLSCLVPGVLSIFFLMNGVLIAYLFDSSQPPENQIAGWIALIVTIMIYIIIVRQGIEINIAVIVGIAVAIVFSISLVSVGPGPFAYAVAIAFSGAFAVAATLAVAVAFAVAANLGEAVAVTIAFAGAVVTAFLGAIGAALVPRGAGFGLISVTIAFAATLATNVMSIYVAWRTMKGDEKYALVQNLAVSFAAICGTNFRGTDLTDVNFTNALLKSTDLRGARLTRTCFQKTKFIERIRPGTSYLKHLYMQKLLTTGQGQGQHFDRQDLRGVNLKEANLAAGSFIDTDFYQANLRGANLQGAILARSNFERADLRHADLTGSCIQNWIITESTKLDGVICDYIYLKWVNGDKRDQMPPRGNFEPSGFVTFVRYILETVELYHEKDINPRLALTVLQKISRDYNERLDIVALGKKGERVFIQVKISKNIAKEHFKNNYYSQYDADFKLWSRNIHHLPPIVDSFIEKRISEIASENTDDFVFVDATYVEGNYTEINQGGVNMTSNRNIEIKKGDYYQQSGNFGIGHMSGGEIKGNAKVAVEINEAEEQDLAEAAAKIQALLEQLSETYPTTTSREKNIVVGEAVDQIENNPTLKAKVINTLKAGGTEAFKEAVNHPLVNILVATIEGWLDAE